MTVQTAVAVAALLVSLLALGLSSYLSVLQVRSLRSANHLPVAIELLTRDLGKEDFQTKEQAVLSGLKAVDPETPLSQLPQPLRGAAYNVSSFYDSMGIMVAFGCIDELLVVSTINYRVRRIWEAMASHIRAERLVRQSPFLDFLEDLACRVTAHDPDTVHADLELRSMPHAPVPAIR
jgi:hypothetical protein